MTVILASRSRIRALAAAVAVVFAAAVAPVAGFVPVAHADAISDKKAEAQQIAGKIYDLDLQIEQYAEAANGAQVELDQLNVQMVAAQAKVDQAEAEQAAHRAELKAYALDAYVHGEPPKEVDVRIDPAGLAIDPRNSYLHAAAASRQLLIDKLRTAEANLKTQLAALDDAKSAATAKASDLKQRQDEAQKAADELQAVKGQIDGELATLVQQAADERAAAEREAAKRDAEQAAANQSSGAPSTSPLPSPPSSSSTDPADSPPVTTYIPTRPIPPGPIPPPDTDGAKKAIEYARAQLGKPYVWGAAGPDSFDCSGLTMQAWKAGGVNMDHWTGSQYAETRPIPLTEVQPGDLIFYNQFQHVALYIGDGKIIHAPHAGAVVYIEDMYYWRTTMAATRPGVPLT